MPEMIVSVGILAVAAMIVAPGLSSTVRERGSGNDVDYISGKLNALRLEAMRLQGAARLTIAPAAGRPGVYVISGHADDDAGLEREECLGHAFPSLVFEETVDLDSPYYLYAAAPQGICFFEDGSATGASIYLTDAPVRHGEPDGDILPPIETMGFALAPADTVKARIDVPLATGLPDVEMAGRR